MASSEFGMSEHNAALLRKFQGNGWTLTCSPASQSELSAIIGDAVNVPTEESKALASAVPAVRYESDWADAVLDRNTYWTADDQSVPLWVTKATEDSDFALFQLPPPDRRWIIKFAGKILEPFSHRFLGWADLHEIMVHGCLLDCAALIDGKSSLAELRKHSGELLRNAELIQERSGPDGEKIDVVRYSLTGSKLHGQDTQTSDGRIERDRWRTCADDLNRVLEKRLNRVFEAIVRKDQLAASEIKTAVRSKNGQWFFNSSLKWMTALGDIPYDAKMVLKGKTWEIDFPESGELLTVPDSAGMRAIARVLMCNNIPCPCALVADGPLLTEFLGRPRHHRYFEAIYRRPRVDFGDPKNSEVENAICAAMHFKSGWYYKADHVITESSELHTICKLPTGKVMLRRADALSGVRDLIKKQQSRRFFCSEPDQQFKRVLADIEAGIEFARKQEKLLEQVQPRSLEHRGKVQKAISRALESLDEMGDWTTRYDLLAGHLSNYIKGGVVFQYTGFYRWKIEGFPQTPDTLDLAGDHKAFKRSKVAKAMRRAKAKMRAMHSLNQLSRGAAC
jgi:hypothetical protein